MAIKLEELLDGLTNEEQTKVLKTIEDNSKKLKAKVLIDGDDFKYVPQYRLDEVVAEREKQKTSNKELSETIKSLQEKLKDNEEADKIVKQLKEQVAASEQIIKDTKVREKVRETLNSEDFGLKAVAPIEDIIQQMDKEKIIVTNDGIVSGVAEQIKEIAEKKSYMFSKIEENSNGGSSRGTGFLPGAKGGSKKDGENEVGSLGKLLAESNPSNNKDSEKFNYFKD